MGKINAYADSPVQNIWQTIQNQKKKKKKIEKTRKLWYLLLSSFCH